MNRDTDRQHPKFELRWGGLHLTITRIPPWLITAATIGGSSLGAWIARH
ncbi:hypothetical protein ABH930_007417 [Kitasatospora sp. GAS204A]|nr:hypothetical protein [Kitasatospora sp. GAS204B]MDH6123027.1 hypothetical protein [Kitasatospora sp. GAS204B]